MNTFSTALIPILVLIVAGYLLKRIQLLPEETWNGLEKLTYFIFLPALLIRTLGSQNLEGSPWPLMLLVIIACLLTVITALIIWYQFTSSISGATFTSIFQGGVRFNTYISLAIAQSFYGPLGLALGSLTAGIMIVIINIACISAFTVWGGNAAKGIKPFMREIAFNPLIISCALGWSLSVSGVGIPQLAGDILEIMGRAALPLGLLAVGAALKLEAIHGHLKSISIASLFQFGLKPLIAVLLISQTGLSGIAAGVIIISFMTPTAVSSYILARQLGGDTQTMASIITFQTLLAFLLMPILAAFLLT